MHVHPQGISHSPTHTHLHGHRAEGSFHLAGIVAAIASPQVVTAGNDARLVAVPDFPASAASRATHALF
jgi:hypothetical protein